MAERRSPHTLALTTTTLPHPSLIPLLLPLLASLIMDIHPDLLPHSMDNAKAKTSLTTTKAETNPPSSSLDPLGSLSSPIHEPPGVYSDPHGPVTHSSPSRGSWGSDSWGEEGDKTGYDYEFVNRIDDKYECPICCHALRKPNQTKCGHRFCAACIRKWIREQASTNESGTCPICFSEISELELFEDNFAKREILCLKIYCPNKDDGCKSETELRNINKHLDVCGFVLVRCPFGCDNWMLRKNIGEHEKSCEFRVIKCEICHQEISREKQQTHLQSECPLMEVTCTYCNETLKRAALQNHTEKECQKVLVNCCFKSFGCSTRVERDQLETHLEISTQEHLRMVAKAVDKLKQNQPMISDVISSMFSKTALIRQRTPPSSPPISQQQGPPFRHPVNPTVNSTVNSTVNPRSSSPPPFTPGVGFGHPFEDVVRQRQLNNGNPSHRSTLPNIDSLSLHLPTGQSDPFPSSYGHKKPVRRQSSLGLEHTSTYIQNITTGLSEITEKNRDLQRRVSDQQIQMVSMQDRHAVLEQKVREQEHTIQQQDELLENFVAQNCSGLYIWKIDNYTQKKYEAQNGQKSVIHSPGFQTSLFGYRLCVRLNLDGVESATGTHVSLFVHFMQGDYDDILSWPFSGKISLAILDQTEGVATKQDITESLVSKSNLAAFQKPRSHRNHKGFGYVEFCPIPVLEGSMPQYIKNNALYIRVKVDIS